MNEFPRAIEAITRLTPYLPGKPISELQRELGLTSIIKLASNENPQGVSPKAQVVMQEAWLDLGNYPDGNGYILKQGLVKKWGCTNEQIILGNGSNDILDLVARVFLNSESEAIYSQYAFAIYAIVTQAQSARGCMVAAQNYAHDLNAMILAITEKTRVIFVANPNNPTGTYWEEGVLLKFLKEIPSRILVVLDEAYGEYLSPEEQINSEQWINQFPNLLICRTFSKAYGLAGLRVGYGLGHPTIIDWLNRVRQPFNVNTLGLLGAAAALTDSDFIESSRLLNQAGMIQITTGLDRLGYPYVPSKGNFVLIRVGNGGAYFNALLHQGIIVRPVDNYQLPEFIRVTIGLPEQNERFLRALKKIRE